MDKTRSNSNSKQRTSHQDDKCWKTNVSKIAVSTTGVMTLRTREGSWVVLPQRAVWIPAGTIHSVHMTGLVSVRSAYVEGAAAMLIGSIKKTGYGRKSFKHCTSSGLRNTKRVRYLFQKDDGKNAEFLFQKVIERSFQIYSPQPSILPPTYEFLIRICSVPMTQFGPDFCYSSIPK